MPRDQTLRIDLGDSSKITTALTLRWEAKRAAKKSDPDVEDWTGEVTFRYEKNAAPRVIEHQAHLADGDYVVEIELITEGGGAVTTRKIIALSGGSTTIDVSNLARPDLAKEDLAKDGAP